MKRKTLLAHLEKQGCELLREGGKHSVYIHRLNLTVSTVPRHKEINDFLVSKICRDLKILRP
jgi:mRNA interferase HicA